MKQGCSFYHILDLTSRTQRWLLEAVVVEASSALQMTNIMDPISIKSQFETNACEKPGYHQLRGITHLWYLFASGTEEQRKLE